MKDMSANNILFANFLAEKVKKENIISELFEFFDIDCLKRCKLEPSHLDSLIRKFNESDECDVSVLEEIIALIKSKQKDINSKENELAKEIKEYVDNTYLLDTTSEQTADALHISYFYMCHIFKDKFDISIGTYRTQKRLEKAMGMLAETDEKISDIATKCGYNNISYFTETFTKNIGISPTSFKEKSINMKFHKFYTYNDKSLAAKMENLRFLDKDVKQINGDFEEIPVRIPDEEYSFLHEAAIIEYHGVLYASWYQNPKFELSGHTPICGKRSYDNGKTWSDSEVLCDDESGKILYCPPIYGICDDKLYMLVNQMIAPDHIHALDLYILNNDTEKFELLWSRPIPFKLNTNVVTLSNGKLMLPGRIAELDGFPNTPAVLISDSGKIDAK